MPSKHFPLSPSSFHRLDCSASIQRGAGVNHSAGSAAIAGTIAHDIAEKCLVTGMLPSDFTDDTETIDAVEVYLKAIASIRDLGIHREWIEATLGPLGELPLGGTADYAAVTDQGLHIVDYKHGEGVAVAAEENPQLGAYALLLTELLNLDVESIELTVVQPRCHMKTTPIDAWSTDRAWLQTLRDKISSAYLGPASEMPGEYCRFCPVRNDCSTLVELQHQLAIEAFSASAIDVAQLAKFVLAGDAIKANLRDARLTLIERGKRGDELPGLKLVESCGHRRWNSSDESEVLAALEKAGVPKTKATTSKMLTPPQLEKVYDGNSKKFSHLITRPPSVLTVVPISDRRGAVEFSIANEVFAER